MPKFEHCGTIEYWICHLLFIVYCLYGEFTVYMGIYCLYGDLLFIWGFTVYMGIYCLYGDLLFIWGFTVYMGIFDNKDPDFCLKNGPASG